MKNLQFVKYLIALGKASMGHRNYINQAEISAGIEALEAELTNDSEPPEEDASGEGADGD